jgi:type I restriction enzyme S subunit
MTLGEIVKSGKGFIQTGPFGSQLHASDYVTNGIPCIMPVNIIDSRISLNEITRISNADAGRLSRHIVQEGDIIYSRRGDVTRKALIRKQDVGMFCGTGCLLIRPGNAVNAKFLTYHLSTPENQEWIIRHAIGATMPNLNTGILSEIPLNIPDEQTQKAIAHILGSLDDKIELNRQMNATLEAMAQALFKSWFVDFDPVIDNALAAGNPIPDELEAKAAARQALGDAHKPLPEDIRSLFPNAFVFTEEMGWIPEGWECTKLAKILEVKYGKDHKKLNDGNIPVYGSGGLMRHADQSLYNGESILIPRKGTLSNLMYVDEEFWTVDTMFFSRPKLPHSVKYLFYFLKTFDFTAMNVGSAVPSMTTQVLNDINALKPSHDILQAFDNYISVFFTRIQSLNKSSEILAKLRDTLLPKLLSGELRITEAEEFVEEAIA